MTFDQFKQKHIEDLNDMRHFYGDDDQFINAVAIKCTLLEHYIQQLEQQLENIRNICNQEISHD